MRIKMQFFKWFEEQFTKTMNVFSSIAESTAKPVSAPNERAQDGEIGSEQLPCVQVANETERNEDNCSLSVMSCCEDIEVSNP